MTSSVQKYTYTSLKVESPAKFPNKISGAVHFIGKRPCNDSLFKNKCFNTGELTEDMHVNVRLLMQLFRDFMECQNLANVINLDDKVNYLNCILWHGRTWNYPQLAVKVNFKQS